MGVGEPSSAYHQDGTTSAILVKSLNYLLGQITCLFACARSDIWSDYLARERKCLCRSIDHANSKQSRMKSHKYGRRRAIIKKLGMVICVKPREHETLAIEAIKADSKLGGGPVQELAICAKATRAAAKSKAAWPTDLKITGPRLGRSSRKARESGRTDSQLK